MTPRAFGDFEIVRPLARGGSGEVFLAKKKGEQKFCVVKRLQEARAESDDASRRFQREAAIASKLDHRAIARMLELGEEDGQFFIASELIEGVTLRALLERVRRVPVDIACAIAVELLRGLHHAHTRAEEDGTALEIVHRDVTPKNLMIGFDGQPKIIDFGVAAAKIDDFKTMPGAVLGTRRYVSPEQALSLAIGPRSDIYSLAVVLYEMLTGTPVIAGGKGDAILHAVLHDVPRAVTELEAPAAVSAAIQRALAKNPLERFLTAEEFAGALELALPGLPDRAAIARWLRGSRRKKRAPARLPVLLLGAAASLIAFALWPRAEKSVVISPAPQQRIEARPAVIPRGEIEEPETKAPVEREAPREILRDGLKAPRDARPPLTKEPPPIERTELRRLRAMRERLGVEFDNDVAFELKTMAQGTPVESEVSDAVRSASREGLARAMTMLETHFKKSDQR